MTRTVEDVWRFLPGYVNDRNYPFINILMTNFSETLLRNNSIKYLVIPLGFKEQPSNDFSVYFKKDRDFYIKILDGLSYLKKIEVGTSGLAIYEVKNPKPRIYLTSSIENLKIDTPFKPIIYTEKHTYSYTATITTKDKAYLHFSDYFDPRWGIYLNSNQSWFQVLINDGDQLSEYYHFKNEMILNSFLIDPDYIKNNYRPTLYTINDDGSMTLKLSLFFKPQAYMNLAIYVFIITIVILLCIFKKYYEARK
jgi:hypothetical protein